MLESVREMIREQTPRSVLGESIPPQIVVAFSGGKDSWAAINLTCQVFGNENVHAYNLFLIPDLECELREIRRVKYRYGITVHRFPHPGLATMLAAGHLQPTPTKFRRKYKHSDVYRNIRNITGCSWIVFGHRMDESLERRAMIKSAQGLLKKDRKAYPLWDWKKHDVYHYLKAAKISAPEQFTEDDTTGFTLGPQTMLYLREEYPEDYRKALQMFPFLEVQYHREKLRLEANLKFTVDTINKSKRLKASFDDYFSGQANGSGETKTGTEAKVDHSEGTA